MVDKDRVAGVPSGSSEAPSAGAPREQVPARDQAPAADRLPGQVPSGEVAPGQVAVESGEVVLPSDPAALMSGQVATVPMSGQVASVQTSNQAAAAPLCPNRQAGPSAVWCFQCGADYTAEVTNCLECGVLTLPYPPTPVTKVGEEHEEHLIYDLHEWSWESRSLMASFMHTEKLVHAWQGASLVVREADEKQVDELVIRVKDTELPVFNHSTETAEYEMEEFSDAQIDVLTDMLATESIPHEFSIEGDLVIQAADEERVEKVFDAWTKAVAEMDEQEFGPGLAGVHVPDLLGELSELSKRIQKNVGDVYATKELLGAVGRLHMLELPFGISRKSWHGLRQASGELAELLFPDKLEELLEELMEAQGVEVGVDEDETVAVVGGGDDAEAGEAEAAEAAATEAVVAETKASDDEAEAAEAAMPEADQSDHEAMHEDFPSLGDIYDSDQFDIDDDLISDIKSSAKRLRKLLKDFV